MKRRRVLFVHSRKASFVAIDRAILAERYDVEDLYQPGRVPNLLKIVPAVLRCDLVFGWFASWHTFLPVTLAWLLRKPSVQIIGGFDTANMPDIGYGYQQGGLRRWASRWIMRRASRLITNSHYSRSEIAANTPIPPERVTVVHHGVPDPFGPLDREREREPLAITVGHLVTTTLMQKGHRPFVEAARHLPDVRFVFVGKAHDDAIELLRGLAPANVEFTGWLSDADLEDIYRRASVYVQASRHEGFGLAVAEAMLAGCVPVVMDVTAMPEVVDGAGVLISSQEPEAVAAGVREALALGPEAHQHARDRILDSFPMQIRRDGILGVVGEALGETDPASRSRRYSRARLTGRLMPDRAETTEAVAGSPSPQVRPRARERGKMRRRLRRQKRMREALLLDLGALVYELHRQGRREPELLQAKAAELTAVDQEVRGLAEALEADQGMLAVVAAGVAGSCENCGSLLSTDSRYCAACGAAAVPALAASTHKTEAEAELAPPAAAEAPAPQPEVSGEEDEPREENEPEEEPEEEDDERAPWLSDR